MPNWCENDLTVEGPKDVIEEFLKFAAGAAGENPLNDEASPFDFHKFIEYPEEFRQQDKVAEDWHREHAGRPDYDCRERPKDGFNSGGCEWCWKNWGTKWPACRVRVEGPLAGYDGTLKVVFHFDTAWNPPLPVIENAAKRYPALTLELRYFECGCAFNGILRCEHGDVITNATGAYFGSRGG